MAIDEGGVPTRLAPPARCRRTAAACELGYAQELDRSMSGFSNFAVSFTIISILSGCLTLYGFGMNTGGPAVIVWGWPFVGIMTLFVGLAMAEVCLELPHRRRPLLLVGQAGEVERAGLVVVLRGGSTSARWR